MSGKNIIVIVISFIIIALIFWGMNPKFEKEKDLFGLCVVCKKNVYINHLTNKVFWECDCHEKIQPPYVVIMPTCISDIGMR